MLTVTCIVDVEFSHLGIRLLKAGENIEAIEGLNW